MREFLSQLTTNVNMYLENIEHDTGGSCQLLNTPENLPHKTNKQKKNRETKYEMVFGLVCGRQEVAMCRPA